MIAEPAFPLTNNDLATLVDTDGFYRFPASWDDYWQLLADADYRADYYDDHIIATMSYESDIHSNVAGRFNTLLNNIFDHIPGFRVFNSNRPIYIETCQQTKTGAFNADGMVISLPAQQYEYQLGMTAETTPVLLIEILSPSTRSYDFITKLPCYKQIPTVQTILYVEQNKPEVIVMERQGPNQWIETRLTTANETFSVQGQPVSLAQVYQGVYF
jgi:Uma2 family endonuclease